LPEGDTIYRAARTLRRALAGRLVTRFESVYPRLTRIHEDAPITGRTVDDVSSVGKHLLMSFSGGLVLRSHLRMNGRWDVYRAGEAWQRPAAAMRVLVANAEYVAVGFNVHDIDFHDRRTLARESIVGALGPDLLDEAFDEPDALRRLRLPPDVPIAMALLDQRRMAGVGNVYKSETLFLCGISPFVAVSTLGDAQLLALVRRARALMRANVGEASPNGIVTYRGLRRTTGRSDPAERLWVYRRKGLPCRRCATPIDACKMGEDARSTYYCRACQGVIRDGCV
jgi:endonuclease-8